MLLFNSKALLSQWKPRDAAAVKFDTCRNLQRHRSVLPAIARHLVSYLTHVQAMMMAPMTTMMMMMQANPLTDITIIIVSVYIQYWTFNNIIENARCAVLPFCAKRIFYYMKNDSNYYTIRLGRFNVYLKTDRRLPVKSSTRKMQGHQRSSTLTVSVNTSRFLSVWTVHARGVRHNFPGFN